MKLLGFTQAALSEIDATGIPEFAGNDFMACCAELVRETVLPDESPGVQAFVEGVVTAFVVGLRVGRAAADVELLELMFPPDDKD